MGETEVAWPKALPKDNCKLMSLSGPWEASNVADAVIEQAPGFVTMVVAGVGDVLELQRTLAVVPEV